MAAATITYSRRRADAWIGRTLGSANAALSFELIVVTVATPPYAFRYDLAATSATLTRILLPFVRAQPCCDVALSLFSSAPTALAYMVRAFHLTRITCETTVLPFAKT